MAELGEEEDVEEEVVSRGGQEPCQPSQEEYFAEDEGHRVANGGKTVDLKYDTFAAHLQALGWIKIASRSKEMYIVYL